MNSLDTENRSVVLYAKYILPTCKRATTLHTETCLFGSSGNGYNCYADGYTSSGSKGTTTITYGSLGTIGQEPSSGDAFDCDVNGDGTFDVETERFYYVSEYFNTSTKKFDNNYYTFIYYSNTYGGVADTSHETAWYSSEDTSYGPVTARAQLPKTTGTNAWRNDLLKTSTRNILKGVSVTSVTGTAKSNFSYSGYAARLLTMQELKSACPNASDSTGSMTGTSCRYFFEKTYYSGNSSRYGFWLENAYSSTGVWDVYALQLAVYYNNPSYPDTKGARPVIEIPKTDVSY